MSSARLAKLVGALMAVTIVGGVPAASAAATSNVVTPRILSAPHVLKAGQRAVVVAAVPADRGCQLRVLSGGKVESHSKLTRATSGQVEFSWVVPAHVSRRTRVAQLSCSHVRTVAKATIRVNVLAHAKGTQHLAPSIAALTIADHGIPTPTGLGAVPYPAYGTVLVPGNAWMQGQGVTVYSNGSNGNVIPPDAYQCVELVNRLVTSKGWGPSIWGDAYQLYQYATDPAYQRHLNGSGYVPVPGDIIVLSGHTWGHVEVVDYVAGGTVYTVEQNASSGGRSALTISGSTLTGPVGFSVVGVIHAVADHLTDSGTGGGATTTPPGGTPTPPGGTPTPPGSLAGARWEAAFQANTNALWAVGADDQGALGLGMAAATSPSIATLTGGGWEAAFQANTGSLWVVGSDNHGDMRLGMAAGTSPSIVAMPNGGWEVAFQANTGDLWVVGSDNHGDMGLGMAADTSPSITTQPNGGWEVAFQANTGSLWAVGSDNHGSLGLGMAAGTSPSITTLTGGGWEAAFQANTGSLWVVGSDNHGDMSLGMAAGTNPSITALSNGSWEVAFQANTGNLWDVGSDDHGNMGLGMAAGTSPSIAGLAGGGWETAFQANTGSLWAVGTDNHGSLDLGMAGGTSPSITSHA